MEISRENVSLDDRLDGITITDDLRNQLVKYAKNKVLKVVNPNLAVVATERSEWGSSGGIGYWDQVRVLYGNQEQMQEWNWRHRFDSDLDKPELVIHDIGKVEVIEKDGGVVVEVEITNVRHPSRKATFAFQPLISQTTILSAEEQQAFTALFQSEKERVLADLIERWTHKPTMPASYPAGMMMPAGTPSYIPYQQPFTHQLVLRTDIGVGAFVTEQQIDHFSTDKQMRHELYLLTHGKTQAELVADSNGYERREGGSFLTIIEVSRSQVLINTKSGKRTIKL